MDPREFKKVLYTVYTVTGLGMECPKRETIQDKSLISGVGSLEIETLLTKRIPE